MNTNLKNHIISGAITFVSTFLLTAIPLLASMDWTSSIAGGAIASIALVAGRAAVKVLWEQVILPYFPSANTNS